MINLTNSIASWEIICFTVKMLGVIGDLVLCTSSFILLLKFHKISLDLGEIPSGLEHRWPGMESAAAAPL